MAASSTSGHVRYAFPKFKVFIYGVEVTDDVVALNKTEHDGSAPNTCQITLLNEFDKYILTTQDMVALAGVPGGKLTIPWPNGNDAVDQSDGGIFLGANQGTDLYNASINLIPQSRKRDILLAKSNAVQKVDASSWQDMLGNSITDPDLLNYFGTSIKKYPLADGLPIFSPMDSVRVAMRDPFNPRRWYWYFAGFVSDLVDNIDENNVKTLTVAVEDPTKLFRYSRVFINPGILDAKTVINEEDLKVQSFYASFLRNMSLPEIFFTLVFGPDKAGTLKILEKSITSANVKSAYATRMRGIGHFAFDSSSIFTFGGGDTDTYPTRAGKFPQYIDGLQTWQSLIDHEVQPSDIITMAKEEDRDSGAAAARANGMLLDADGKLNTEAVINYIGTHWDEYLVDGGKLMLLIPDSFGVNNTDLMMLDVIQSYNMNSECNTMGKLMIDVVERIQFSMYATPKGDIIIEPPLYDFDPDDFGLKPISGDSFVSTLPPSTKSETSRGPGGSTRSNEGHPGQFDNTVGYIPQVSVRGLIENFASVLAKAEAKFPGRDRGPYGSSYIIPKHDTYRIEAAFVDEKVQTVATCGYMWVKNQMGIGDSSSLGKLAKAQRLSLIPIYGVRVMPLQPRGYMSTPDSAHLYAEISLDKLNSDAHTTNVMHVPNIKLWINRPIYVQVRNFIGTTKQVTQSLTWGAAGDMSSTSDLYAIRTWDGSVAKADPTQPVYTTIGGVGSSPINYARLYGKPVPIPRKISEGEPDLPDAFDKSNEVVENMDFNSQMDEAFGPKVGNLDELMSSVTRIVNK
jgi:hypothetical protein